MKIETDKREASVTREAHSILAVHRPGAGGICQGCYEVACSFAWFPCPQAQWAQAVLTYGAGDQL